MKGLERRNGHKKGGAASWRAYPTEPVVTPPPETGSWWLKKEYQDRAAFTAMTKTRTFPQSRYVVVNDKGQTYFSE